MTKQPHSTPKSKAAKSRLMASDGNSPSRPYESPSDDVRERLREAHAALIVLQNDYDDKEEDFTTPPGIILHALDAVQTLIEAAQVAADKIAP